MAHALAAFSIAKEAITSMADFQESIYLNLELKLNIRRHKLLRV